MVSNEMNSYIKYPRTPHLPWSKGKTADDKTLKSVEHFNGQEVVVTIKMDGENSTFYQDHYHARSLDSKDHWSRSWAKQLHSRIRNDIPLGWRLCGENMYVHIVLNTIIWKIMFYFLAFGMKQTVV